MQIIRNFIFKYLKKTEKYTKTDMVYLVSNGYWFFLNQIISILCGLILIISLGNFLPQEIYGNYKFILSVASILVIFSLNWMPVALIPSIARGFEGTIKKVTKTRIKYGLIGWIFGLLIGFYYLFIKNNEYLGIGIILISFFIPFVESFGVYDPYLQGRKQFKALVYCNSGLKIISLIFLTVAITVTNNIYLILFAYFATTTFVRFFNDYIIFKIYKPNNNEDDKVIDSGKHLSFSGALSSFANYLDSLLIFYFLGPVKLAIYSFALAPVEQIRGFLKFIPAIVVPKFAQKNIKDINFRMVDRIVKMSFIGIVICASYILIIPYLFKIILPQYESSILFSQILALIFIFNLPNNIVNSAINSKLHEAPQSWVYYRNIPQIIFILCLIITLTKYGLYGVVISKILFHIATLITNCIQWRILIKNNV